jgi:hypothetical protein
MWHISLKLCSFRPVPYVVESVERDGEPIYRRQPAVVAITSDRTVLEERFGLDAETADEPNQIEFVGDLIRYIESSTKEEKLEQTG